jgi:hypothetical protein
MISLKDDPEAFPVRQLTILGKWPLRGHPPRRHITVY